MTKHHTVLRFALKREEARRRGISGLWVKGASFSTKRDAGRNAVTRVTYTEHLAEAAPMSRAMAEDIAVQFYKHVVSVHRSDTGELIGDATREVQLQAQKRRAAAAQVRAEFEQFLREAADAVPGLRQALWGTI